MSVGWLVGWLLTGGGFASPGHAGVAHIGAEPVAPGTTWVGGAAGVGYSLYGGASGGFGVEAGTAIGSRGAFQAGVYASPALETGWFRGAGTASGRYNVVQREGLRLAVTGQLLAASYREFTDEPQIVRTWLSPGLAIDTGSPRVRFDAALPVGFVVTYNQFVGLANFPFPLGGTLGVSGLVGSQRRHRLRFGLPEFFSWHYRGDRAYVDVGGIPFVAGFFWLKVGHTF